MDLLPETETPDVLSLTPTTKRNIIPPVKAWGRLVSTYIHLKPVDLFKEFFQLGRSEDSDVIISEDKIPKHRVTTISKKHFVITREDDIAYITDLSKNGTFLNGKMIGKGRRNILQNNDEIAIGFKGLKVFIYKVFDSNENTYLPPSLRNKYEVSRLLGVGACGEVRLVYDKVTCYPYAIKKIVKANSSKAGKNVLNHPEKIKSEINILQTLKHPCVIETREVVETDEAVFLVLEYMEGGELRDLILTLTPLSENQAKFLFYQMVLAVQYLHENDVTHRDLKPENVLLKKGQVYTIIKISDFGLSKLLDSDDEFMQTVCGTPNYVAPEIIDKNVHEYTQQVDIWSLGVILFYMLCQELPFQSLERSELNRKILLGTVKFEQQLWKKISAQAKDLICRMLTVNPKKRIRIDEIKLHPWINEDPIMKEEVEDLLFSSMSTDIVSSADESSYSYSPAPKRSKLSQSFEL